MEKNKFILLNSKKYTFITVVMTLIMEVTGLLIIICTDYIRLGILIMASCTPFSLIMILGDVLFRVEVSDKIIKVRTNFGRKYEFNISNINVVECRKTGSIDTGTHYFIILETQTEHLQISDDLIGFNTMAGYLLDKLQSDEINHNVISPECQEILVTYKNNEYRPKKRDRKGENQDKS